MYVRISSMYRNPLKKLSINSLWVEGQSRGDAYRLASRWPTMLPKTAKRWVKSHDMGALRRMQNPSVHLGEQTPLASRPQLQGRNGASNKNVRKSSSRTQGIFGKERKANPQRKRDGRLGRYSRSTQKTWWIRARTSNAREKRVGTAGLSC